MSSHARDTHSSSSLKAQEYLSGWKRARAELDNFRKNMAVREEVQARQQLHSLILPLLSLADNFRAIVQHVPPELEGNSWATGVLHVARQMEDVLQSYGVEKIETAGIPFDPKIHEAVEQVKDKEKDTGTVLQIVLPGYKIGESVIRPAKVKVVK
jgi:molecular chaperone GrpE